MKPELLAPVGTMDALHAALRNGADAVYLGAQSFGARSAAGFSEKDLLEALRTAHLYRRKVYVTLNTLIKQQELDEAVQLAMQLDALGVDALIIQDFGVAGRLKEAGLNVPLHASTQMSIHNAHGARLAIEMGISRVVLARECSPETIREVVRSGVETEVFIHGALCVSVSGQCLLSSQIGGRSGNRGRCAQPCRLRYQYRGMDGAWLSPRDLLGLDRIQVLLDLGVSSFKIEGRLKSPEYVASTVSAYRRAINVAIEGQKNDRFQADSNQLIQVFSRGGFTSGLTWDRGNKRYINPLRVSHEGVEIGTVLSSRDRSGFCLSDVRLTKALHNGDHLQLRGQGEQELTYSGPEVEAGAAATLRHHKPAGIGTAVYRLLNQPLMTELRRTFQGTYPPLDAAAALELSPGKPAVLHLQDDEGNTVQVSGAVCQEAVNSPITEENAYRALSKRGDSPFAINKLELRSPKPSFLTVGDLNAIRREGLVLLKEKRLQAYKRAYAFPWILKMPVDVQSSNGTHPRLLVRTQWLEEAQVLKAIGPITFLYAPQDYARDDLADQLEQLGNDDYFCLPRQLAGRSLEDLHALVKSHPVNVLVDNIGQLSLSWPKRVIAGDGIPAWNTKALQLLEGIGCAAAVLSPELALEEVEALQTLSPFPLIQRVYGRVTAMLLNHCPERTFRQLDGSQTSCHLCEAGQGTMGQSLKDSRGASYPLYPLRLADGCLNQLLFHTPLHLSKRTATDAWLIDLTVETKEEARSIVRYYAALLRGEKELPHLALPYYLGRALEGVT